MRRRRVGPRRPPGRARAVAVAFVLAVMVAAAVPHAASAASPPITVDKHVPYVTGGSPNQTVDIYRQEGSATGRPAIVFVHGGGFAGGSPDDLARQARLAAQQGWVSFNVDYRATIQLGTQGQAWPAELDDVETGLRWVHAHAAEFGAAPDALALVGASAGGTLAGVAAADPTLRVRVLALWSAPTELAPLVPGPDGVPPACGDNSQCLEFWQNPWVTNMIGCTPDVCPDRYDQSSVLNHAADLPPSYLANGTEEIVPFEQARRLEAAVRSVGTTSDLQAVSGAKHAQTYSDSVWNDTMSFLARGLGVPEPEPIDFGNSPLHLGWATVAVILAVVGIVVAVVARIVTDRRRGRYA